MVEKILDIAGEEVSKAKSNVSNKVVEVPTMPDDNSGSEALLRSNDSNLAEEIEIGAMKSGKVIENTDEGPDVHETDLEDVHKLLMDENSDSDSDEDEDLKGSAVTVQNVQNLLFQDQDFSDSEDEEEENQYAVPPQHEPSVMEKVSAFISSIPKIDSEEEENTQIIPPQSDISTLEIKTRFLSSTPRLNGEMFSRIN